MFVTFLKTDQAAVASIRLRRGEPAFFTLAVTLLLTACSTVGDAADKLGAAMRTVEEPAEPVPHALMRISTNGYTWVQPGKTCESMGNSRGGVAVASNPIYIGARSLRDQVRGVAGAAPEGVASGELRVIAGEPLVLVSQEGLRSGSMQYGCRMARSFVPEEGAHYQTRTFIDVPTSRCGMVVVRLLPTPTFVPTVEAPKCPKN